MTTDRQSENSFKKTPFRNSSVCHSAPMWRDFSSQGTSVPQLPGEGLTSTLEVAFMRPAPVGDCH